MIERGAAVAVAAIVLPLMLCWRVSRARRGPFDER